MFFYISSKIKENIKNKKLEHFKNLLCKIPNDVIQHKILSNFRLVLEVGSHNKNGFERDIRDITEFDIVEKIHTNSIGMHDITFYKDSEWVSVRKKMFGYWEKDNDRVPFKLYKHLYIYHRRNRKKVSKSQFRIPFEFKGYFQQLKTLKIYNFPIGDHYFENCFTLEKLQLESCNDINGNKLSIPNLKVLKIEWCNDFFGNNMNLPNLEILRLYSLYKFVGNQLSFPKLKHFEIRNFLFIGEELTLPKSIKNKEIMYEEEMPNKIIYI